MANGFFDAAIANLGTGAQIGAAAAERRRREREKREKEEREREEKARIRRGRAKLTPVDKDLKDAIEAGELTRSEAILSQKKRDGEKLQKGADEDLIDRAVLATDIGGPLGDRPREERNLLGRRAAEKGESLTEIELANQRQRIAKQAQDTTERGQAAFEQVRAGLAPEQQQLLDAKMGTANQLGILPPSPSELRARANAEAKALNDQEKEAREQIKHHFSVNNKELWDSTMEGARAQALLVVGSYNEWAAAAGGDRSTAAYRRAVEREAEKMTKRAIGNQMWDALDELDKELMNRGSLEATVEALRGQKDTLKERLEDLLSMIPDLEAQLEELR